MEEVDYTITHVGNGAFKVEIDGDLKDAGPNLCGMIRYTYFEDFALPPLGWQTTRLQLLKDYQPKVFGDIMSGKIKPNENI